MGELSSVEFDTGLPQGQYCDLIENCSNTTTITVDQNGKAILSKGDNYQMVAFMVAEEDQ